MIDWKGKIPAVAFLALASCSSGPSEINGNLGNGTFSYTCVSSEDPACATDDGDIFTDTPSMTAAVFPTTVASGGRFKLAYQANDSRSAGNPDLRPVSQAILDSSGLDGTIQAMRPGKDGLVVRSTVDSNVYDFTYITVSPISSVGVIDKSGSTPPAIISAASGDTLTYVASALGPHGEKLAGSVDYTWTVDDPTLLSLGEGNPIAKIDVTIASTATSGQTGHLTVTQGTLTQTLAIKVQ